MNKKNNYLKNSFSNYDKFPFINIIESANTAVSGWKDTLNTINDKIKNSNGSRIIVTIDFYPGVFENEIFEGLIEPLKASHTFYTGNYFKTEEELLELTFPNVTDDAVFGYMTRLNMMDFFDESKISQAKADLKNAQDLIIVYGPGATCLSEKSDILIFADMPRWEIQMRFRRNEISNLGISNKNEKASLNYKRAFFVDWRVADRLKKKNISDWDFVLDTTKKNHPNLIEGESYRKALNMTVSRPFRVVPFFDPGPWGGQWMKEICDLDRSEENFAWCFDCVPEENSLLLKFGNIILETPSINLIFYKAQELLGSSVQARFGDEFPIRFDFLDTMEGGNLSLQVHPTAEYIKEKFGMPYTQDESYYLLDAGDDAYYYLGLKDSIDPESMIRDLKVAQEEEKCFDAEKYVNKWPGKKHDHILIPAGTIHCSGTNCMVLEISATPYIFTFKLWDWGRMGLDGKPRPINIDHGSKVIDWDCKEDYTKNNLINVIERVAEGDGWTEERTGLYESQFIETRRFHFSTKIELNTNGGVNVLNLVEGLEAIVESPTSDFEPFVVHYAETFIVPAAVGAYTIRPFGKGIDQKLIIIKAFVKQ